MSIYTVHQYFFLCVFLDCLSIFLCASLACPSIYLSMCVSRLYTSFYEPLLTFHIYFDIYLFISPSSMFLYVSMCLSRLPIYLFMCSSRQSIYLSFYIAYLHCVTFVSEYTVFFCPTGGTEMEPDIEVRLSAQC